MHLSHINSLRGIAILMVIVVHTSQLFNFNSKLITGVLDYGKMGVQLFFIASAYTLCLSYSDRNDEIKPVLKFYFRRYFRIFPIYYLGIGIYFILNYLFKDTSAYTLKNIFANIFFIHGFIPSANNSIVPGGWSIGVEMIFYLFFPFLFNYIKQGNSIIKGISIILLSQFSLYIIQKTTQVSLEFYYFNILNQLSVFIIGILFFLKRRKDYNIYFAVIGFLAFTFLGLYTSFNENLFKFRNYYFALRLTPFLAAFSFCFLFIIIEKISLLNNIILQKIGINSYSIYIVHFVFAFYLLPNVNNDYGFILTYIFITIASYIIAIVLNKYIEKPFIKIGGSIIKSKIDNKTILYER